MTIKEELADIPSDGLELKDIQKEEEKETPAESPAEKKPEEEKEEKQEQKPEENSEEDKIPFHKHPRFKELVEEKNQYKQELDKLREEVQSQISEIKESRSGTKIPAWFTELYGENETAWNKYQEHDKENREEIKRELRDEIQREQKEKEESANKWNNWIEDQINSLKEEGKKFDRNELMKVMMEYKPSDENGNLDFQKGYQIMEVLKKKDPEKINARKEIVDEGNSKAEPQAKKWFTPDDMRGKGW